MSYRTILHSDLNNFYASVETVLHPELKGKPLAVCGRVEERRGIVLAKNYPAKACGIQTGETVWQARLKCPELITIDPHYDQYIRYSRLVREIYGQYTDQVEAFGMDENWLDVTGSAMLFGDGETIAHTIRRRVKNELGLTVSVGVSFNKIFAKLGSDMKKPDAVTCIGPEDFREKIWHLPAGDLLGVGKATARELGRFAIHTIGDLARAPDIFMAGHFGVVGTRLKRFANGQDDSPVLREDCSYPIKSVGNGTTFLADLTSAEEIMPMLVALSDRVAVRLRRAGKKARGIALTVKCPDLSAKEWQTALDHPTANALELARAAHALFRQNYPWVKPIRAMTVRAIRLDEQTADEQINFFSPAERLEKNEALDRVTDKIRGKYGREALYFASARHAEKYPVENEDIEMLLPAGIQAGVGAGG